MIREVAAALSGVASALAAFLIVLLYPGVSTPLGTDTGFYRQLPITNPIFVPATQSSNLLGVSGIYSGVLPASILVLLALGAGIVVSQFGRTRLRRDGVS